MLIGKRIQELREAKKLSLTELSKLSGVQLATLSRMENLKMVGTLESHMNIAKALGVDITHLYRGMQDPKSPAPSPQKPTTDVFSHNDQAYYEILTNNVLSKKMMPVLLKVEPGGKTNREQNEVGAEKFIFVLEGELEVKLAGKSYPLKKNQTFYFDASLEHWFVNAGAVAVKAVCVVTPVVL